MYRHILIPTDGSRRSDAAARAGVALARALGARVTAFFAAPPATPLVYGRSLTVRYMRPDAHARLIERTATRVLDRIERLCATAGVPCRSVRVTNEFPAEAIVAMARRGHCDLICMASHGRRGLSGVLLGSETQKVLTHSTLPVLVVR